MKMKTLIPFLPFLHGRMFVRGVIITDQVDFLCSGHQSFYQIQKTDPLLMPMSFHTGTDYAPICYVEGGKERSCSIAFVVMGHRPTSTFFQRQTWLRPIKSLYLAFFITGKNHRMLRRGQIEPHNVFQLLHKMLVV